MQMKFKKRIDFLAFLLPTAILILWIMLPFIMKTPDYLLPSPSKILSSFSGFVLGNSSGQYSGQFIVHSMASWYRVLVGFVISSLVGVFTGLLSGYFSITKRMVDPFIHAIRMVPGIGWFPLAMVWFGVGNKTTIFLIALAAFFPTYVSTVQAVESVPQNIIDVAKVMGASTRDIFFTVVFKSALPGIFSGLRLGMGLCWSFLVLGELTGVNEGLGAVMMNSRMLGDINMIIVCMICISIWGKLADIVLQLVYKFIRPGV